MPATFQVYRDKSPRKEWRWRLVSSNNVDIIATSGEGYTRKESCLNGIAAVQREAPSATVLVYE